MRILLIETATALCSVALAEDGAITESRESAEPRSHASLTAPFVAEILASRGLGAKDCDAVCVSMGPGSYTGLRVGASTAKGLCFGAGIPLLAVGTLDILAWQAIGGYAADTPSLLPEGCKHIVPMIDARRMEVYSAVFSADGRQLTETQPLVVTPDSFSGLLAEGPTLFIGDGAMKCRDVLQSPNAHFVQACPKAAAMLRPAIKAFEAKDFRDVAYFEPLYLKAFIAKVSTKNVLAGGAAGKA